MITNILATITLVLVTNTTVIDNSVREPGPYLFPNTDWSSSRIVVPATEKFETTTIVENRTLHFSFEGYEFNNLLSTREVESWTRHYRLKSDWEYMGQLTNYPAWKERSFTNVTTEKWLIVTNFAATNKLSKGTQSYP